MYRWLMFTAALCLSCGSAFVSAQDAEYQSAAQEMEQLIAQAAQNGRMPRLQDERVKQLISVLSDNSRFLDSATYQLKDLGLLMDMCGRANSLVMSYALFDMKKHIDPKASPTQVALQVRNLMVKNALAYQDELERLQPFSVRCMAREIPLLGDFVASLKPNEFTYVRRAGLRQARTGIFETYYGFLQAANDSSLKESYRARLLEALSETAKPYSSILQLAARQQVVGLAKMVQRNASASLEPHLASIIDAMSSSACTGLCNL